MDRSRIVTGNEVVDVGHRCSHAYGERLHADIGWPRIHPDQPTSLQLDPLRFLSEKLRIAPVPSIAEDDHDRPTRHATPTPGAIELGQRRANPRAPGPVPDFGPRLLEGPTDVAVIKGPGQAGQAGGEDKGLSLDPGHNRGAQGGEKHP